jgi:cellulose synthase/poly-beta-1,6-N-acetylglucosamine synthase-like glycosyltransferase
MISLIVYILLACYALFIVWLLVCTQRYSNAPPDSGTAPAGVSLVIPFKNEAHNLQTLLASLARQEYAGPWEVLLVNDGSSDNYLETAAPFLSAFPARIRIVDSVFDKSVRLTSKQQALDAGVREAGFEWLVFSDADMIFEKDWLAALAANAVPGRDLVFGHTAMAGKGLFTTLQRFQLEFLFAVAYSFHSAGIAGSCMGNNLLVRKKAYTGLGGQAKIGYSIVEDRDLYIAFKRCGYAVAPAHPFSARAATLPSDSIPQFYRQMLRWARGGFSFTSILLPAGLLLTAQNFLLLAALYGLLPYPAMTLSFANFFLTMLYLYLTFRKTGSGESALFFPVYYLLMLVETVVFLFSFFITPKVEWKRRKL